MARTRNRKRTSGIKTLPSKAAAVLTAGAPTSPLMAGALTAIYEKKKTYDWIFTSGSGSLVGLSLVAPKGKSAPEALHGLLDMMVSDSVYDAVPLAHKVFFKSGPWSEVFRKLTPFFQFRGPQNAFTRTFNDWVSLGLSAAAPTDLKFSSKGLCNPNPWIEEFVDFDKLKAFKGDFTVNAYNITDGRMEHFEKDALTADHLRAATACPFIYGPFRLGDKDYYEGADVDPINFPKLETLVAEKPMLVRNKGGAISKHQVTRPQVDGFDAKTDILRVNLRAERLTLLVFDVLGSLENRALVRLPRNLLDSYAISLTTPLKSIVTSNIENFKLRNANDLIDLEIVNFDIPEKYWPYVLDWTDSNANRLWDIGYKKGVQLAQELGDRLPDREPSSASPEQIWG